MTVSSRRSSGRPGIQTSLVGLYLQREGCESAVALDGVVKPFSLLMNRFAKPWGRGNPSMP
ncbi:MAG: hypothetical protein ABSG91_00825 [Syntrophobacteraceae bacterium]